MTADWLVLKWGQRGRKGSVSTKADAFCFPVAMVIPFDWQTDTCSATNHHSVTTSSVFYWSSFSNVSVTVSNYVHRWAWQQFSMRSCYRVDILVFLLNGDSREGMWIKVSGAFTQTTMPQLWQCSFSGYFLCINKYNNKLEYMYAL